ncbi:MAG: hypothetical protein WCG80_19760 [Spirochaetales bacterium]
MTVSEVEGCLEAFKRVLAAAPQFGQVGVVAVINAGKLVRLKNVLESSELPPTGKRSAI